MLPLNRKSRAGFSLIEVMISLCIFTMLILLFALCMPVAKRASVANGQYAQALSLCQHKIDQMRAVGFGRLTYTELHDPGYIDDTPTTSPFSFVAADSVADVLNVQSATITISQVPGNVNQMKVVVSITWKPFTYTSQTNTVSISAIITNVG